MSSVLEVLSRGTPGLNFLCTAEVQALSDAVIPAREDFPETATGCIWDWCLREVGTRKRTVRVTETEYVEFVLARSHQNMWQPRVQLLRGDRAWHRQAVVYWVLLAEGARARSRRSRGPVVGAVQAALPRAVRRSQRVIEHWEVCVDEGQMHWWCRRQVPTPVWYRIAVGNTMCLDSNGQFVSSGVVYTSI